jgi:hypothetical protein
MLVKKLFSTLENLKDLKGIYTYKKGQIKILKESYNLGTEIVGNNIIQ